MGYQIVVWEGPRPESDAAASDTCGDLVRRFLVGEPVEPTPAIRQFVADLTEIWPDDPNHPAWDNTPWKYGPLIESASGPVLFLNMRFGHGERATFLIAEMAEKRGLVTFDTYVEVMRPCPKQVIDDWNREAWAQVLAHASPKPSARPSG